jgi:hypothetical protein
VPTYTSRARTNVAVGDVMTTEVPGLAEALRRPGITVHADLRLTTGADLTTTTVLPDAVGMLALKSMVRTVRNEARDVEDLWRCLEIAAADDVDPAAFDTSSLADLRRALWAQLGPDGTALPLLTSGMQEGPAARRRTRVRALLADVVGPPD